jgi:hypothetical protein
VRGLYAVSFPILDSRGQAIAALTVPYAERIDRIDRKSIATVEEILGATAQTLSRRMGGAAMGECRRVTEHALRSQLRKAGKGALAPCPLSHTLLAMVGMPVWSGLSSQSCKKLKTMSGSGQSNCSTCPNHGTRIARLSFLRGNGTVCQIH